MMTLSHYLARAGICSRRKATLLIKQGRICINKEPVLNPAFRVQDQDQVYYQGKVVSRENYTYLLLHKPKGCISSVSDDQRRGTVMNLVKGIRARIYPVGRLDYNTTGVLLLTNDGALAHRLAHPRYNIAKVYHVM
ncbi:MAG: pseudouridine synthase, partial [Candidatus Babeliales bacterium]